MVNLINFFSFAAVSPMHKILNGTLMTLRKEVGKEAFVLQIGKTSQYILNVILIFHLVSRPIMVGGI